MSANNSLYDIAIIGGGPGGYSTALRAAELNLKVALIEKDKVGGTCLHRGCIPATSLLQSAQLIEAIYKAEKFGIKVEKLSYDWQTIQKTKSTAINRLFMGLKALLSHRKVDVFNGFANLKEPNTVHVQKNNEIIKLNAKNIVIATGSRPQSVPKLEENPEAVLNTTEALEIEKIPKSITIIGGGAYGVEFASLFRSFGSEVNIIETAPRLLPRDDSDISKYLERAFRDRGINVYKNSKFTKFASKNDNVEIEIIKNGESQTIISEKVLATVGRTANTDGINIQELGIQTRSGFIVTDEDMQTNVKSIYAVGDVTFNPQYANFAFQEGIFVAEKIAGLNPKSLNLKQIPIYTFGYPEIAKVGYSEEEAKQKGLEIEVMGLPFQSVARSAIEKTDIGYIKMIALKNGPIIGIHIVGPGVINMIAEAALITNWEATAYDVAELLHPHPTFSEAIGEVALKLAGKPLHSL